MYPGPCGPGLIEASLTYLLCNLTGFGIRGLAAPASLKHDLRKSCRIGVSLYPGPRGPGLVEARLASW